MGSGERMKLYRLTIRLGPNDGDPGGSGGYKFAASKKDAAVLKTEQIRLGREVEIDLHVVQPNKKAMLSFLNLYASHYDNG